MTAEPRRAATIVAALCVTLGGPAHCDGSAPVGGLVAGLVVAPAGDPVRGETVYQVCMGCHSLDEDDVGPRHRGVVGRTAGSVPDFGYSPALRNAHIVWTVENLDRWLANPQALVPGTRMFFAMPNAQDRADVIAYLSRQR